MKLKEIETVYQQKKEVVIATLLNRAIHVQPELHRNLKKPNA